LLTLVDLAGFVGENERAFVFWQRPRFLGSTATRLGALFGFCQGADGNDTRNAVISFQIISTMPKA